MSRKKELEPSAGVKIKDWYISNYPSDELGRELNAELTFDDVWDRMNMGEDFYNMIEVWDSIVRERLFIALDEIYGKDAYRVWLDSADAHPQIQESKQLNEGPGAGYTIKASLVIDNINSMSVVPASVENLDIYSDYYSGGGATFDVTLNCDIDASFSDLEFESYYYGDSINSEEVQPDDTKVHIDRMKLNVYETFEDLDAASIEELRNMSETDDDFVKSLLEDKEWKLYFNGIDIKTSTVYGGGWGHSTYNGTLARMGSDDVKSGSEGDVEILEMGAVLLSQKVIDYVDKCVQGDNFEESFTVYDEDDEPYDSFDDADTAIEYAKSNNLSYVSRDTYKMLFDGDAEWLSDESDVIWKNDNVDEIPESFTEKGRTFHESKKKASNKKPLVENFNIKDEKKVIKESYVNIRQSLNQMDKDTCCEYDLVNLYESKRLSDEDKKVLAEKLMTHQDEKSIYAYLLRLK